MKYSITRIGILFICTMLIASGPLYSQPEDSAEDDIRQGNERTWSVSIGFGTSYSWWTPLWGSFKGGWLRPYEYAIDPNFLYGPLVMVQFNPSWGLSGSFTYGTYRAKTTQNASPIQLLFPVQLLVILGTPINKKIDKEVTKMDADLLLNYAINKYARIVLGPKYQGYSYIEATDNNEVKLRYDAASLGAGMNFTIQITGNFYFNPAFSVIGLYGFERISAKGFQSFTVGQSTGRAAAVGGNGAVMFSGYIPAAWMTIAFGYKAQCIYYFLKQNRSYSNDYDLFHGPYVAVIVTF